MKLKDLTAEVRGYERSLAPGSETALWDEFWNAYRPRLQGWETLDDSDLEIPEEEADEWLSAYEELEKEETK